MPTIAKRDARIRSKFISQRMFNAKFLVFLIPWFSGCITSEKRVVSLSDIRYPATMSAYIEIDNESFLLDNIAIKKGSFAITHRYWSIINGWIRIGNNNAIVEIFNKSMEISRGDYAGNIEVIAETCTINHVPPFNYFFLPVSCFDMTIRGDIYSKK